MSDFQALLQEMAEDEQRLQKALENEDGELQDLADDEEDELDEDDDDEPMGKSLNVTLENGETVHAIDGTALVKSLMTKQEQASENIGVLAEKTVGMLKALSSTIDKQNAKIESLQKSLTDLGAQGRGRKSKVTIHDRQSEPTAASSGDPGEDIMSKAMAAFDAGKITGIELNTIDVGLRSRQAPSADLLAKII